MATKKTKESPEVIEAEIVELDTIKEGQPEEVTIYNYNKYATVTNQLERSLELIRSRLSNIAYSFMEIGRELTIINEDKLYLEMDYKSIYEFAEDIFNVKTTTTKNLMAVYLKYCQPNSHNVALKEKFKDYSYSQLVEIMSLSNDQLPDVSAAMTIKEIRQIKSKAKIEANQTKIEEEIYLLIDNIILQIKENYSDITINNRFIKKRVEYNDNCLGYDLAILEGNITIKIIIYSYINWEKEYLLGFSSRDFHSYERERAKNVAEDLQNSKFVKNLIGQIKSAFKKKTELVSQKQLDLEKKKKESKLKNDLLTKNQHCSIKDIKDICQNNPYLNEMLKVLETVASKYCDSKVFKYISDEEIQFDQSLTIRYRFNPKSNYCFRFKVSYQELETSTETMEIEFEGLNVFKMLSSTSSLDIEMMIKRYYELFITKGES